jgi:hypothetical protein
MSIRAGLFLLALLLATGVLPADAQARGMDHPSRQPRKTAKKVKRVKPPPPPLFVKHHRGTYRNSANLMVIDATPQSPPLETDDPGVPDKGEYEINFTSNAELSRSEKEFDFLIVDANYGIEPTILGRRVPTQVKLEFPLEGEKSAGEPMRAGVGPFRFGFKLNVHNNEPHGVSLSLYPQIEFGDPGTEAEERGQTLILPVLVQKELKYLTAVGNAAWNRPIHASARHVTGTLSLGVGRALTPHVAAMAEIHSTSTLDLKRERLIRVNLGLMRRLRDDATLYGNIGHSIVSDEGPGRTYIGIGLKVTRMGITRRH